MAASSLPAQIARTRRFTLGVPGQFTVPPDGGSVLFLRSRAGHDPVTCLWSLDLASGTERLLGDPAVLLSAPSVAPPSGDAPAPSRPAAGIAGYATDAAVTLAAFPLGGVLWTVDVATGQGRRLAARSPVADPRPDPAGRHIAYLSGGALRVIGADGAADRALMAPGDHENPGDRENPGDHENPGDPDVTFGTGDLTAATSLTGPRGYWWAPDGARLLVTQVDSTQVPRWHIADPAHPARPPRTVRYPAAGGANPEVTLWIAALDGSRTQVRWDRDAFAYLPGAGWDAHGPYAVVQSRDQRTVRFLRIDPGTGDTFILNEQWDQCWVQLIPGLPARSGDGTLIGHADRHGTRQLTVGGVLVTPPGLQLRAVLDTCGDDILFAASDDPAQTHLWTYHPAGGLRRLTTAPGVHDAVRRAGTLVHTARCAGPPGGRTTVVRLRQLPVPVASQAERPVIDPHATPLVLGPRELRAELYLPSWYRPGHRSLPVLVNPYGGAGLQVVTAELTWRSLVSQWFAEQGFAVLVADGSGTPGRGPDWEREVHGDIFGPVLADQVTALTEAARLRPELDLGRVGIRGWSFSGSLAALAVLRRPDVFHVAVAGAGVTDQRLYTAHWRERFLGHPDKFPQAYRACSLLAEAAKLTRPLLLMHGLADDNVYPVNTLRLSSALLAAGLPHEVLLLPGTGHHAIGGPVTEPLLTHQLRFLQRHLGPLPVPGPA